MRNFLILVPLLLFSCDITENRFITVINNSNEQILCFVSKIDLNDIKQVSEMISISEVNKDEFSTLMPVVRGRLENFIKDCKDKKIRLYIIEKDSVDKYGWKNIYKNNIYNKKNSFSIEDLEKINWEVVYE